MARFFIPRSTPLGAPGFLTATRLDLRPETHTVSGLSPQRDQQTSRREGMTQEVQKYGIYCPRAVGASYDQHAHVLLASPSSDGYASARAGAERTQGLSTLGILDDPAPRHQGRLVHTEGAAPPWASQPQSPPRSPHIPTGERHTLTPRVLVIDDDSSLCEALTVLLEDEWEVYTAGTGREGLTYLAQESIPVVVLDLGLPDMDGLTLLDHLQATSFAPAVLILTGVSDLSTAVSAMQRGAIDYLTKPFDGNTLRAKLRIALTRMRGRFPSVPTILDPSTVAVDLVIGSSVAMHHVWETLLRVADTHATVLLLGESGVGKSQFAQALHQQSPRRTCPFVTVHCAYLTQALAASTLFGHERGAFTGAERQHDGAFVRAHTGTLFLDEVGSLPLDVQGTLLHVLQNGTFERLGGKHTLHVDVRVIAASNQNLAHLVAAGTFREDLFYRLNVVTVHLPPLRARRGDIPLLVATFLARYNAAYGRAVHGVTEEAMQMLRHYAWPGNVRQLENIIARLVALSRTPLLQVEEIHGALRESWPLAKPEA